MTPARSDKAALRGEPSYIWREGQERRLAMVRAAAGERVLGNVFEDGCGVGMYLKRLAEQARLAVGLEIEHSRASETRQMGLNTVCGAGEGLPFSAGYFDLVLSHEVLEHVADDRKAVEEIARVLKPGGRLMLFIPNKGYPFETHGIYWRGKYRFGNIPLVNYLPRGWRNKLAPHVRVYSTRDVERLLVGLPLKVISRSVLFGAYDNVIAKIGWAGKVLRGLLQFLERTPLRGLGLSHFWVVEKT